MSVEWKTDHSMPWPLRRLKTVAELRTSNVDKNSSEDEQPVRLCNYTDVYYSSEVDDPSKFMKATATPDEIRRFRLRRGDVLITKDSETADDIAVPAHVARDFDDVLCGYHLAILRPNHELVGKFLYYALLADRIRDQFTLGANGITRFGLSQSAIKDVLVPVPDLASQRAIAAFLDRETARIDTLIEKKRRLLDLLEEKRTALITRAVTRGLDPDVPMKDSGVEWIGEIPEHWEVLRLRKLARKILVGSTPPTGEPRFYESEDVPWYGPGSFGHASQLGAPSKRLDRRSVEEGAVSQLPGNSVLVVTIGATLGKVAVSEEPSTYNQQITGIHPRDNLCDFRYLGYQLGVFRELLRSWSPSTTLPILNQSDLSNFQVVLPPLQEQVEISEHLVRYNRRTDELRDRVSRATALLQEYRTALISAAVTGKIGVTERALVPA